MSENESRSLDVLGVKPISDSIAHITKATVDGASTFLAKICLPAAEEFGFLLQDKVRNWRTRNTVAVVAVAEKYLQAASSDPFPPHAHPRLVATVLENGSWSDDKTLQDFWGGLLAASCSSDGSDDGNIIFANLLAHLTSLQVRVLAYACESSKKKINPIGLIAPDGDLSIEIADLQAIAQCSDIHRLDRELDNLRGLELIAGGFDLESPGIDITPTPLALNLYVRCHGHQGSPAEFFGVAAA